MNTQKSWSDAEKVAVKGSVILTNWKKEREEARAVVQNSDSTLVRSGDMKVLELFGINQGKIVVNAQTAQRLSAVGACIGIIGDAMSTLPLHHFKRDGDDRKRVVNSPLNKLLNQSPIQNWTASSMYQWWVRCNILRGDAITEIIRNKQGEPINLLPYHPDRVQIKRIGNEILYQFTPFDDGKTYVRSSDDVLHIAGNGFDGEKSLSVIQHDANHSIGIALATNQYSKKFFENGASPKHLFSTDKEMGTDQIDQFRELYDTRYAGPSNAGRPMILTEGLKVDQLSMSSVDAQLLENLKYSVIDIARACRVPPVLIGAQETTSSWGTGVGEITLGFVKYHLEPKAYLWEQEINRKLVRKDDEFVEFQFKGFLRGDAKAEGESLRQARGGSMGPGWLTLNEIRKLNNEPPIDGGDVIYEPKGATSEQKATAVN